MLSIAVVQTKVISCYSSNKSCLLQVVHTKAIAALTQFCDFFIYIGSRGEYFTKFPDNYRGKVPNFCGIYLINEEELGL